MNIQYGQANSSTNSMGKVSFITCTAAAFAFAGFTSMPQGYHALTDIPSTSAGEVNPVGLVPFYEWEARLKGSESSGDGGENLYVGDSTNFAQIYAFALSLLGNQTDIPSEFNEVFQESFWDILA